MMSYNLAKTCEFLKNDAPLLPKIMHKSTLPGHNHLFVYEYAKTLDKVLDLKSSLKEAKPQGLLFQRLIAHTSKHLLHKYKRNPLDSFQYRMATISDFNTYKEINLNYVEFPLTEDLVALKKQINQRTPLKVKDLDYDTALDELCNAVLTDNESYSTHKFKNHFILLHKYWLILIDFMQSQREDYEIAYKIKDAGKKNQGK